MVASKTLEQRVEHALRPRVLTTQALTILIRAAFVGGEYIPLKFLIDLNENAPLHIRLALRNDLTILDERVGLISLKSTEGTDIDMPPAMTMGVYRETMVGVNAKVTDCLLGKCMAKCSFGPPHMLPTTCSTGAGVVISRITDAYARLVRKYEPVPQEHLGHFENLTKKFDHVFWKHMMTPIAIYGCEPDDHIACLFLVRAHLMISYAYLCLKNWELGLQYVLRAKYIAKNTALRPPGGPVTDDWDYDIDLYKETFLGTEDDWIKCLLDYARTKRHPRGHIERDLDECAREKEYWEIRDEDGAEEAAAATARWEEDTPEPNLFHQ